MKKTLSLLTILSVLFFFTPNSAYAVATTWNPSDKNASITLSNGNLTETIGTDATWQGLRGTVGVSSGKYYWEVTINENGPFGMDVGIATSAKSLSTNWRDFTTSWVYNSEGGKWNNGGGAWGAAYSPGDIIGVALDMTAGKIWWAKNGTWQASGDPGAGTNEAFASITGTVYPGTSAASNTVSSATTVNFGATAFTYTPPTGFSGFDAAPSAPAVSIVGLVKSFWVW